MAVSVNRSTPFSPARRRAPFPELTSRCRRFSWTPSRPAGRSASWR